MFPTADSIDQRDPDIKSCGHEMLAGLDLAVRVRDVGRMAAK